MRWVPSLVLLLLAVGTAPLGASAQTREEGATSESSLEEPAASAHSSGDEGGLSPRLSKRTQRKWDPSAYDVRDDPRPHIQYTSAPRDPARRKRARRTGASIGLVVSVGSFVGGLVMVGVGASQAFCVSLGEPCETPRSSAVLIGTGAALTVGGLVGTIVSAMELSGYSNMTLNGERTWGKAQSERNSRRVRWDRTQSRVVF